MTDIYQIPLKRIDGTPASLASYQGQVLLIVNVASQCGLTPQYEGLEKLHARYRGRGLTVLGFPANEFGNQEPGSNEEIQTFCSTGFGVSFPMFEKLVVKGEGQHPLYALLTRARPSATAKPGSDFRAKLESYGFKVESDSDVLWNFEKFLINRRGEVIGRFAPDIAPEDPLVVDAIESELATA